MSIKDQASKARQQAELKVDPVPSKYLYLQCLQNAGSFEKEAVPKDVEWFNIRHYDLVQHMPLGELLTELTDRKGLIDTHTLRHAPADHVFSHMYRDIVTGHVLVSHYLNKEPAKFAAPSLNIWDADNKKKRRMEQEAWESGRQPNMDKEGSSVVRPLIVSDVTEFNHRLTEARDGYSHHKLFMQPKRIDICDALADHLWPHAPTLYFAVTPRNVTDDVLIQSFKKALRDARKRYDISDGNLGKIKPMTVLRIIKLFELNILPLVDLLLWQLKEGCHLPLVWLYNTLKRPDSKTPFDSSNFKRIYLGYFEQIFFYDGLDSLRLAIAENPILGRTAVAQIKAKPEKYKNKQS
ncbi:Uncharacterised protein [Serratia fonticola]|uniref:Uncharacterized protein n=1 Tax=Serratia fonticola TaxID=47917 RepID=A0A0F7HA80_SERFO|nr:DUF6387 family protein [Serratia fonticola]AKG69149.1 hypothetical protein WN53_08395 [Serratia fonticola]CAI1791155.1 Uncharacterised protein [Serratia fonticola]VTR57469.1 Uncharacterised protein [Serratia fonticola]